MGDYTEETIAELRKLVNKLENGEARLIAAHTDIGFSLVRKNVEVSHVGGRAALMWETYHAVAV